MAKKKNSKKKNPKVNKMKDQMIQEQEIRETEAVETAEVTKDTVIIDTSDIAVVPETETPGPTEAVETPKAEVTVAPEASEPEVTGIPEIPEPESQDTQKPESAGITMDTVIIDASDITDFQESEVPDVIELSGPIADEPATDNEPVNETPTPGPEAPVQDPEPVMHEVTEDPVQQINEGPVDTEFETMPHAAESPVETTALTKVIPAATENTSPEAEKKPKESKFKDLFGDKPVTRKFLAIALASALLLNAVISAGLMGFFAGGIKKDIEKSLDDHNPKQLFDHDFGDQGGGMTPPDWNNDNDRDYDDGYDNDWDDDRFDNDWDDNDDRYDDQYGNDWGNNDDDNYSGAYPWSGQQESNDSQQSQQGQQNASGVTIGIVISENNGVYITEVTGNNAQKAGFKAGDRIVSFDGKNINDSNSLISEVQNHKAGDKVKVIVERDGKETTITTTLE